MPREGLYRIGEVARLFQLSVSSLRHYEALDILRPEYTDPETGYRYYSTGQFEALNTIRYLRLLDTPLDRIREFLASRDIGRIQELLRQQKAIVAEKRRSLELLERKIDNRLRQIEDAVSSPLGEIRIMELPPRRIAVVRHTLVLGPDFDLEPSIRELEAQQPEAMIFLGKIGVGMDPDRLLRQDYSGYDFVFLLLDREDSYRGETLELPAVTCAVVRFRGSHPEAPEQYRLLANWLEAQHLAPAGPSWETTLIDYGLTNDPEQHVTQIQIPVSPLPEGT